MSVPKSKRSKTKCIAVLKASDLVKYVLTIAKNEKQFKPEYSALTEDIIHCSEKIYINCYVANNIYVNSKDKLYLRIKRQQRAVIECNNLLALINLAYKFNHLDCKRVMYWTQLVIDARDIIKSWSKADKERYKMYK